MGFADERTGRSPHISVHKRSPCPPRQRIASRHRNRHRPSAQRRFYRFALGLRLVKKTVNFDSPDTYHLHFGNESGQPGTLITFCPWPGAPVVALARPRWSRSRFRRDRWDGGATT